MPSGGTRRIGIAMRDRFNAFYSFYSRWLMWTAAGAGAFLFALAWLVSINAVSRKVLNAPIPGTTEATEALMPLLVMLPMAFTQFRRGHVRMTMVTEQLPDAVARSLQVVTLSIGALFMAWLTYASWTYAMQAYEVGETVWGVVRFPIWPTKFCISIGAALLSFQYVLDVIRISVFMEEYHHPEVTEA